jgi:hypothetical protein
MNGFGAITSLARVGFLVKGLLYRSLAHSPSRSQPNGRFFALSLGLLHREKRTCAMNWDQIEGNWKQFKGRAKQQWGN